MGFPYPPYQVISINDDNPENIEKYVLEKIRLVNVPNVKNDRIGVTLGFHYLEVLLKGKTWRLHIIDEKEISKRVLQKHEQYRPMEKIVLQHTVDAKCSGVSMKDDERIIIETIIGDALPLLQGETSNFESWNYYRDKK